MSETHLESIGGIAPDALVRTFGSPLYVYDLDRVRRRAAEALAFAESTRSTIYYSAKANANGDVLRAMKAAGVKLSAASPGEVVAAKRAGFSSNEITLSASGATDDEMRFANASGIEWVADSLGQLDRFGSLFAKSSCGVRVNPEIGAGHHKNVVTGGPDSKFGVDARDVGEIPVVARRRGLIVDGYHQHVGSGILDPDVLVEAMKIAVKLAPELGADLRYVNFGGGWGIPYRPTDRTPDLDLSELAERAAKILDRFREARRHPIECRFEPGRRLVADAGFLLTTVTSVKRSLKHTWIGTDTGMNHLLRPALYDAYHDIRPATALSTPVERQTIVGNICESGDILAKDRLLPRLAEGDLLAVLHVGAYGYSMASDYNLRPRPAEVVVDRGEARLSRRRKTLDELVDDGSPNSGPI